MDLKKLLVTDWILRDPKTYLKSKGNISQHTIMIQDFSDSLLFRIAWIIFKSFIPYITKLSRGKRYLR